MVKKAVILCGGLATRFLPITKSIPKEMLPLLDKPILQVILEQLKMSGITDVLIVIARGKECIAKHFDKSIELEQRLIKDNKLDILKKVKETEHVMQNIYYVYQTEPRGTGGCIDLAKTFVGDDAFVLMFGDEVFLGSNVISSLIDTYEKYNKPVLATYEIPIEEVNKYGIIKAKEVAQGEFEVLYIVEKPSIADAPSNLSYMGPSVLTREIFDLSTDIHNNEEYITDRYNILAQNSRLMAKRVDCERFDMGNVFGFIKANILAGLKDKRYRDDLQKLIVELAKKLSPTTL